MTLKEQNQEASNLTEEEEQEDEGGMSGKQASRQWHSCKWFNQTEWALPL